MARKMREAFDMMSKGSLRRGLQIVPLQAAWQRWRCGLAGAAKAADALRQRQLRTALGAWKRRADGADVKLDTTVQERGAVNDDKTAPVSYRGAAFQVRCCGWNMRRAFDSCGDHRLRW